MTELENQISRIVNTVAEVENIEPARVDPPLGEVVDPDALKTLIESSTTSDLEIRFVYRGHDVVIDESGRVQVD
jgi:hypothetical protein